MLQPRFPELVRPHLGIEFGLLGGEQLGPGPVLAHLLVTQPPPGGLAPRVKLDDAVEMCDGLLVQSALLAPEGQLPLVVGLVEGLGPPPHVFLHECLACRVGGDIMADLVGSLPLPLIRDQAK